MIGFYSPIICSSDHLTDFAAFEGDADLKPPESFNRDLLWLLMLLFIFPIACLTLFAVVMVYKIWRRKKAEKVKLNTIEMEYQKELDVIVG